MFRQYHALKRGQPESILLFRMGDFYEMFYDDAKVASRLLELTLTARGKGTDHVVPMCGFPHHQLDGYAARLVRARRKVAICEQVEDPKKAKGLVRREVIRVITPGTMNDPSQLEPKSNVWIAAVARVEGRPGAAFLDASTGEFLAWEASPAEGDPWRALGDRLQEFAPREIVHPEAISWPEAFRCEVTDAALWTATDPFAFAPEAASETLQRQLRVASLDGFGLRGRPAAVAACGGLLQYVQETQRSGLEHIDHVVFQETARGVILDSATRRNLELERNLRDGGRAGSLVEALDTTLTPGGGRLLRRWLAAPLLATTAIEERLDAVQELRDGAALRQTIREQLRGVYDVERLLSRTVAGTANPRDLLALAHSLGRLPALRQSLEPAQAKLLDGARADLDPCADVRERIAGGLVDDPPAVLRDGGVIREGFDPELDELRTIRKDGRAYIASLEQQERQATGIASLKVRFNKVFGYFLEVSKSNLHLVPEHYVRKQTIANGERYITPELKEYEAKVLQAQERIAGLEQDLFKRLCADVVQQAGRVKAAANVVSRLDVLSGLAETAALHDYCRPGIDEGTRLQIVGGRHPVVEQTLLEEPFVPNDTDLVWGGRGIAVLTGPNMGGKSTYLRQVALIALMAQAGSFVPARKAHVGTVDRIFCRVGASDSLSEGQSTFMVEMTETANILHHATPRSLLLLDEIGRGTSTFDGLSIAWAVVEHLAGLAGGAPRTLFATHYHELTELAAELNAVVNLRMAVRESGDQVAFLHHVEQGASDRSYGIHVARLAGVPLPVVQRATEILANIERDEYGRDGLPRRGRGGWTRNQPSLFEIDEPAPGHSAREAAARDAGKVLEELRAIDADRLTPLAALNLIAGWLRRLGRDAPPDRSAGD
jgi:DNA mismatch repair protein MutS